MKRAVLVAVLLASGVLLAWWAAAVGTLLVPVCDGIPFAARSFRCHQPSVYGLASLLCLTGGVLMTLRGGLRSPRSDVRVD
jgi:hypothetical protein